MQALINCANFNHRSLKPLTHMQFKSAKIATSVVIINVKTHSLLHCAPTAKQLTEQTTNFTWLLGQR